MCAECVRFFSLIIFVSFEKAILHNGLEILQKAEFFDIVKFENVNAILFEVANINIWDFGQ